MIKIHVKVWNKFNEVESEIIIRSKSYSYASKKAWKWLHDANISKVSHKYSNPSKTYHSWDVF